MKPKNVAIVNYGAGFIIVEMYRNMNHVADMHLPEELFIRTYTPTLVRFYGKHAKRLRCQSSL